MLDAGGYHVGVKVPANKCVPVKVLKKESLNWRKLIRV